MSKPITPSEVTKKKKEALPAGVFDAFNELIAKHWNGSSATFKQDEVAKLVAKKLKVKQEVVYDNHYLDVEELYEKAGWVVDYDKPGFNETYAATFEFSKKSR